MLKSNIIHLSHIFSEHSEWLTKSKKGVRGTKGRSNQKEAIVVDDPENQISSQTKCNYIYI